MLKGDTVWYGKFSMGDSLSFEIKKCKGFLLSIEIPRQYKSGDSVWIMEENSKKPKTTDAITVFDEP